MKSINYSLKSVLWWLTLIMNADVGIYLISSNTLTPASASGILNWEKQAFSAVFVSAGDEMQPWRDVSLIQNIVPSVTCSPTEINSNGRFSEFLS